MRHFEDFREGETIDLGPYPVSAEEIVEFAEEYDPAPFHLSEEAARETPIGRLCASGWHCCSMAMRMMCDSFLKDTAGQGAPGIDRVRWLKPVFPHETLTGTAHVVSVRPSRTRPSVGIVSFRFEFFTTGADPAFTIENSIMIARRNASVQGALAQQ